MFPFFYQLLLHIYAFAMLPRFLWQRKGRPLATWFGHSFPRKKFDIWIHAVSLGEAKAMIPLINQLKDRYTILVTSTTATGHAEVKRSLPDIDCAAYLPLDLSYIIRPIVRRVSPSLFLLCETDYWPNLLKTLKEEGSHVAVVNGKISSRSADRLSTFSLFAKAIHRPIDHFCVQDKIYADRFEKLGVSSSKITVTGNLKYENPPTLKGGLAEKLKLQGPVVTVGSTHEGEEALILSALEGVKILLVPRHPHRFDGVAELLERRNLRYGRYSQMEHLTGEEEVILIDTMGILADCYALSELAIVGGSFFPGIGGHNVLEPLWALCPPIFGPHMEDQPGMVDLIHKYNAGVQVPIEKLGGTVSRLIEEKADKVASGKRLLKEVQGATQRTLLTLEKENLEPKQGAR